MTFRKGNKIPTTHGMSYTPEYRSWIKARIRVKRDANYSKIQICDIMYNSFDGFIDVMGRMPQPRCVVDRIDNNGHYSCGGCLQCLSNNWSKNVRWLPKAEHDLKSSKERKRDVKGRFL